MGPFKAPIDFLDLDDSTSTRHTWTGSEWLRWLRLSNQIPLDFLNVDVHNIVKNVNFVLLMKNPNGSSTDIVTSL